MGATAGQASKQARRHMTRSQYEPCLDVTGFVRQAAFEGSLSTALTSISARDENNSSSIWNTINIRDPLPSTPTTGMVSPRPRQPQWTPKPGFNFNPCVPAEAQKNTRFMSIQVEEDPRRPSRKNRRPGSPRARLPSMQPVRVVS